jgi:hypothetical protein
MQVRINRKPVAALTPALERALARKRGPEAVEALVLDEAAALQAASRSALTILVMVGIFAVAVNLIALKGIASRQPQNLPTAIPVMLIPIVLVGIVLVLIHRWRMKRTRERLDGLMSRMPPPQTTVRANAQGLDIGGLTTPWSRLSVEAVDIASSSSSEGGASYTIDTLFLRDDRGREIVLDTVALTQGRKLLEFVWRAFRPPS